MKVAGMEVPIIGSDSIKWIDLTVPSSLNHIDNGSNDDCAAAASTFAPPTADYASAAHFDGEPPFYLIWRIHKAQPNTLEILKLSQEFPLNTGLRLMFSHQLSPFAFICVNPTKSHYLLYTLTVTGIAYCIKLSKDLTSICSRDQLVELDVRAYLSSNEPITRVTASYGRLLLGRNDGSVTCLQLDLLHQTAPGFAYELRDDSGIRLGRLWGFMSRGRAVGAVHDLIITRMLEREIVIVLHGDGILRAWDLQSHSRILSHPLVVPTEFEGATSTRLWLGESDNDSDIIPLAILYKSTFEVGMEMISVYGLCYGVGDRMILSVDPSIKNIPVDEGGCIDVKLTSDKIWILKDNGLTYHPLFNGSSTMEETHCYALQEEFIADQLFQSSEHASDDLLSTIHSIFPSGKDRIVSFVSSIFLRRLLHPGVFHNIVLRETFLDYSKHWTDNEFQSLTVDGLKKEILSLVEHESIGESPISVLQGWKNFCCRYFEYWCKNNAPYALIVQSSSGAVGLIRKYSVSLFRGLENTELLMDGLPEDVGDLVSFGLDIFEDKSDREILFEVLRCVVNISQQLGKTASFLFYESFVGRQNISSEEIIPRLVKILETGYGSPTGHLSSFGAGVTWERELIDHKNKRKFSVDMLLSLHVLCKKADSWKKVLDVIETYLQFLVPQKFTQNSGSETLFCLNNFILVQASAQIAKVMFESALDILLFVSYLIKIGGQINMTNDDISRIQLELVPMIEESIYEWLIILFFSTTPSESPAMEDFSYQLSLLQIDNNKNKRSWSEKLGKCDFTLASLLLLNIQSCFGCEKHLSLVCLPSPHDVTSLVQIFTSWIVWGNTGEDSSSFLRRSTELAIILLRHGQYDAVEYLLTTVEANARGEKTFRSIQDTGGDWCLLQHLLGCCLLAQTQRGLHGILKENKVCEAVSCFFRAASGEGASKALQSLSHEAGLPYLGFTPDGHASVAWKLLYYQWAMQLFEQYNISEGACQFALAALEQVDGLNLRNDGYERDASEESATTIKGRLWANIFKFTLDLNLLNDAYCAIVSNPDEESKYICLRRFIIVLYERGGIKILCNGQLPSIGLADKIERELAWKAERTDILAKPNPYKLLYAFEMHRHNWRRAASYIYLYSARLRTEAVLKDQQHTSITLQERLNALSAAVNALHLVHPAYAWIDPLPGGHPLQNEHHPNKKAKKTVKEQSGDDLQAQRPQFYVDIEKLECEFVLTSAEYLLSLANIKWTYSGIQKPPSDLVELLVQTNLYDMAFGVLLKFWKDSELNRELEKIFCAMSLKCCPGAISASWTGANNLLLTSSKDELVHYSPDVAPATQQNKANCHWETLEHYLEKYKYLHVRLPLIVAETLLRTDPQIELPLWLVKLFKESQRERSWGMAGQDLSPASLFRLYVDYGRYTEATNLFLEYLEAFASLRPVDIVNRKRSSAVWFPYNTLEKLWCQLEGFINSGHMVDQCNKLKSLLRVALLNHLNQLKVDSDDVVSSAG